MNLAWRRAIALLGLAGPAVIIAGVVLTALEYHGRQAQGFSPLNHFTSELGEVAISRRAEVFNAGLVVGGLCMAGFMAGLGFYLHTRLGAAAAVCGAAAALACSAVGLVPMDDLVLHLTVAGCFFAFGLAAMVLFTILVVADWRRLLPMGLLAPGVVAIVSFALLLAMPAITGKSVLELLAPQFGDRPAVWMLPILEWMATVSVVVWIVWVAIVVWRGAGGPRDTT